MSASWALTPALRALVPRLRPVAGTPNCRPVSSSSRLRAPRAASNDGGTSGTCGGAQLAQLRQQVLSNTPPAVPSPRPRVLLLLLACCCCPSTLLKPDGTSVGMETKTLWHLLLLSSPPLSSSLLRFPILLSPSLHAVYSRAWGALPTNLLTLYSLLVNSMMATRCCRWLRFVGAAATGAARIRPTLTPAGSTPSTTMVKLSPKTSRRCGVSLRRDCHFTDTPFFPY